MKLEEELHSIKTKVLSWKTLSRQQVLTNTIGILLSNEPSIEDLLENGLEIGQAALLELTLKDMKSETIKFSKRNKIQTDNPEETLQEELQNLIS